MEEKKIFEDSDEFLVKQIEAILKENNIPYSRRDEGAGSYINVTYGQSFGLAKSIYVSSEDFEKAQNVIQIFNEQDFKEEDIPDELKETPEELEEDLIVNKKYGIPKKIFKMILILCIGLPLICLIIGTIIAFIW